MNADEYERRLRDAVEREAESGTSRWRQRHRDALTAYADWLRLRERADAYRDALNADDGCDLDRCSLPPHLEEAQQKIAAILAWREARNAGSGDVEAP